MTMKQQIRTLPFHLFLLVPLNSVFRSIDSGVHAFVPLALHTHNDIASRKTHPCLFGQEKEEELPPPLFERVEEEEDAPLPFPGVEEEETHDPTTNQREEHNEGSGAFFDIVEEEQESEKETPEEGGAQQGYYSRDDDDILTEREDRFYVNDVGAEKCILIGVLDLSEQYRARGGGRGRGGGGGRQKADLDKFFTNPNTVLPNEKYTYESPSEEEQQLEQQQQQQLAQQTAPTEAKPVFFTLEESLTEMRELLKTAGMDIAGEMTQNLQQVNPRTYIGTGKLEEIQKMCYDIPDCNTVVFDAELSPGQQKQLENIFNKKIMSQDDWVGKRQEGEIKVIDRTALILDIFAQHAKTREGKLQVELALNEYRKPRLTKMWTHLERQSGAGGVGLRGPGETQLEMDKRLIRDRIILLKGKIDNVSQQRSIHRRNRLRTGLPLLSLVGYTNAGKSTLLNQLTRAGVLAESMLFATLDPTTRKVKLPGGMKTSPEVLLTDTVGFIQKLPTQLVAAFRATLEEVCEADVLIHVIDVSNPTWEKQEQAVMKTLRDINALVASDGKTEKPIVRVLNKIDMLSDDDAEYIQYEAALSDVPYTVATSSLHGTGMPDFVAVVEEALQGLLIPIEATIPYAKGDLMNEIHQKGHVDIIDYRDAGTYIVAKVPNDIANKCARYGAAGTDGTRDEEHAAEEETATGTRNKEQEHKKAEEEEEEEIIDWVALGRGRHSATGGGGGNGTKKQRDEKDILSSSSSSQ